MAADKTTGEDHYKVREAVAVFDDPTKLEDAVQALESAGFDHSQINLLAKDDAIETQLGHRYQRIEDLEDRSEIPQAAFVDRHSVAEGQTATIGVLAYLGGIAGVSLVASGGTLAAAIAAAVAGGGLGGALGGVFSRLIGQQHGGWLASQLEAGGLLLWVTLRDDEQEAQALEILSGEDGRDVHVHDIERGWGADEQPLGKGHLDPWLVNR